MAFDLVGANCIQLSIVTPLFVTPSNHRHHPSVRRKKEIARWMLFPTNRIRTCATHATCNNDYHCVDARDALRLAVQWQAAKTSIAWNAWSVKEFASLLVVCADNNNQKIGVHNLFSYRAEGSTAHTGRVRLLLEQKNWSTHTDDDVDMYKRTKEKS